MIRGYPEGVPAFDVDAFIEEKRDFFDKWMLFETVKPKHRRYTCSHCGYTFAHDAKAFRDIDTPHDLYWDRVTVNDRVCCPECNRVMQVKNRKTFTPPYASRSFAIYEKKLSAAANPDAQRAAMHFESMVNSYGQLKKALDRLPEDMAAKIRVKVADAVAKMSEEMHDADE